MVQNPGRTRPWSDVERRACDWSDRRNRPVKSLACAAWPQIEVGSGRYGGQRWERRAPAHGDCDAICGCNCHYKWILDKDMVRLRDGAVGVVLAVEAGPDYLMAVRLGQHSTRAVDVGEAVLLEQEGDL